MTPTLCRSCGREIVWAKTEHGKAVPLDPKALVFSVAKDDRGELIAVRPTRLSGELFMVSHFATCPDANKWSGKHREPTVTIEQAKEALRARYRDFSEPKEIL